MASSVDARRSHLRSPYQFIRFWQRRSLSGETIVGIANPMTGSSPMSTIADGIHTGDKRFCAMLCDRLHRESESETDRMAHFPAHLLDTSEERRNRIEGHAGALAPFLVAINDGHLHSSSYASKARCASSCFVLGISCRTALQCSAHRARRCQVVGVWRRRTRREGLGCKMDTDLGPFCTHEYKAKQSISD
jgi:hypothetical protein